MKFILRFLGALLIPLSFFIGMRLLQPAIADTISSSVGQVAGVVAAEIGGVAGGFGGSGWGRKGYFDSKFVKP